jgi:hypothetical protein
VFTARYGLGLQIKRPALRLLKVNEHFSVTIRAVEMSNLYFLFTEVTDKHVDEDRHNVEQETRRGLDIEN